MADVTNDDANEEDDEKTAPSTALVVVPGQGAPAPNDPTSSADEAEDEDEGIEALDVTASAWVVIHSVEARAELNGLLGRVLSIDASMARVEDTMANVLLVEGVTRDELLWAHIYAEYHKEVATGKAPTEALKSAGAALNADGNQLVRLHVRRLQTVTAKDAVGRLVHAWVDTGPATLSFSLPIWGDASAEDEKMRVTERGLMHNYALEVCNERLGKGVVQKKVEDAPGRQDPRRQVRLQLLTLAAPTSVAASSGDADLRLMPFHELCTLLHALEQENESKKGHVQRRMQAMEIFWRNGQPPRHQRSNLVDAFRLLLPHHEARRYYLGETGLAKAVGLAMGLCAEQAAALAEGWHDGSQWAQGAEFAKGRELPCVLEHEWNRRFPRPPTAARVTLGEVNDTLDRIDRAHAERGRDKARLLRELLTGRCNGREVKWLSRIVLRHLGIGERASMPVAHKGEWPKIVMDGFCRAQGRLGRPSTGNPPLLYTLFRHRHSLQHVARLAQRNQLPTGYPPPVCLGVHIRAQGSTPCVKGKSTAALERYFSSPASPANGSASADAAAIDAAAIDAVLERFAFTRDETDRRVLVETKYDGFRLQIHYDRDKDTLRFFYRSGVDSTPELAADLAPAVRLALGAPLEDPLLASLVRSPPMELDDVPGAVRYTWLLKAWRQRFVSCALTHADATHDGSAAAGDAERAAVASVILDGELLVYDECETEEGIYDELGSRPGVVSFGTHFWLSLKEGADGKPVGGNYSRHDCRRHYLVKVFDVLYLNGRDLVCDGVPLLERRALMAHAFTPIPHYMEFGEARLVDLVADPSWLRRHFGEVRAAGEEGLMLKAAARAYVPNARTNVLKLKAEFISGLGDTVTLLVVGARYARQLGRGREKSLVCELALAAPSVEATAECRAGDESGRVGPFERLTWLCNTAALSYHETAGMEAPEYKLMLEQMLDSLSEEIVTGVPAADDDSPCTSTVLSSSTRAPSRMRRLGPHEPLPPWLLEAPTSKDGRPHFVLREPSLALKVEVLGSRFLKRYTGDPESTALVPWKLRFPRIRRCFHEAAGAGGTVVDSVESFRRKGCEAWLAVEGQSWPLLAKAMYEADALPEPEDEGADCPKQLNRQGVASLKEKDWPAALDKFRGALRRLTPQLKSGGTSQEKKKKGELRSASEQKVSFEKTQHGAFSLSAMAAVLEKQADERPSPRLTTAEAREALRVRVCAWSLLEAQELACHHDDIDKVEMLLREALAKLAALCEREEVKDVLHGWMVEKMERKQALRGAGGAPDLRPPVMRVAVQP